MGQHAACRMRRAACRAPHTATPHTPHRTPAPARMRRIRSSSSHTLLMVASLRIPYQAEDLLQRLKSRRFYRNLGKPVTISTLPACASCGCDTALKDRFCASCGHSTADRCERNGCNGCNGHSTADRSRQAAREVWACAGGPRASEWERRLSMASEAACGCGCATCGCAACAASWRVSRAWHARRSRRAGHVVVPTRAGHMVVPTLSSSAALDGRHRGYRPGAPRGPFVAKGVLLDSARAKRQIVHELLPPLDSGLTSEEDRDEWKAQVRRTRVMGGVAGDGGTLDDGSDGGHA